MNHILSSDLCPCGSQKSYHDCCQPFITHAKNPVTAEQLLRSRYTAFVIKDIDYVIDTHHPITRNTLSRAVLKDWIENSVWQELKIISVTNGGSGDDEGMIEFRAKYTEHGKALTHYETSVFKKYQGEWYFYDTYKPETVRIEHKIGRNDPCSCGSGKKFKKCCG